MAALCNALVMAMKALSQMFSAIPLSNRVLKTHALAKRMLNFNNAHTIYDPDYRPPTFRRGEPSRTATTATIPLGSKRTHGEEGDDEPPSKRAKQIEPAAKEPAQEPKKMPKKASGMVGHRLLRSGKTV
ncbi:hypothetical protein DFH09DRAFT_1330689 [Mycena vulgaris]|nr:hypothetical protein DFH09DRAFT_1330689 [Mycena vulgaris]